MKIHGRPNSGLSSFVLGSAIGLHSFVKVGFGFAVLSGDVKLSAWLG